MNKLNIKAYYMICGLLCCIIVCGFIYCLYLSIPAQATQKAPDKEVQQVQAAPASKPGTPPTAQSAARANNATNSQAGLAPAPHTAAQAGSAPESEPASTAQPPSAQAAGPWQPLLERLKKDGTHGADVDHWFASLTDPFSSRPMGVKVTVLFKARYVPPYFAYFRKPAVQREFYTGVVTEGNITDCLSFLEQHDELFTLAEELYQVPKEILVALLMVETRLGNFIGSEQAFWSLACMAASTGKASVQTYLDKLPYQAEHDKWLQDVLTARSEWAYTELKALILYCRQHEHNPLEITGSIYGAIGLCQFMPSNIPLYAVDGNKDGKIDLFLLEDAVQSAANFLQRHGWKLDNTRERSATLLRTYNNSTIYANTILALADGITALALAETQKTPEMASEKNSAGKEG